MWLVHLVLLVCVWFQGWQLPPCISGLGNNSEEGKRRLRQSENQEICDTVSPRNDKEVSPMIPQQRGCLNKPCIGSLTWKRANLTGTYMETKNYRQLRNAEIRRTVLKGYAISWSKRPRRERGVRLVQVERNPLEVFSDIFFLLFF